MSNQWLIETLKSLASCEIKPHEWREFWDSADERLSRELPRTDYLRIKPGWHEDETWAYEVMWQSQKGAVKYLQKCGVDFKVGDYYEKEQKRVCDGYYADMRQKKIELKRRLAEQNLKLAARYPKFFKAAVAAFEIGDKITPPSSSPRQILPRGLSELLCIVGEIVLDGINISSRDVGDAELSSQKWIFVGEYWLEADGDALLMRHDDERVYYYAHEQQGKTRVLCKNIEELMERELTKYLRKKA
jgi:hypothetical protein